MRLTDFDNQKLGLTNIVKNLLEKKYINADDKLFNFEKSIKNLADIDKRR